MARYGQRVGPSPAGNSSGARAAGAPARHAALAGRIGNRAMQRLAAGEIPGGLSAAPRSLQRDPPKGAKPDTPKGDKPDRDRGMWVKFQGGHSSHGDWLPLGNFSMVETKGSDEISAFVDVLADSPKGLHLGEALDEEEPITVLIEQRQHNESPIRQGAHQAVIISVSEIDEVNPTGLDPTGTYDLTTRRRVIRVGLHLTAPASKRPAAGARPRTP